MVILSRKDLERISERVLRAYRKLPEFENKRIYRIEPEILIEHLLKLKIEYRHLSMDNSIFGVTTPAKGQACRIFDDEGEDTFYRFDGRTVLIESNLKDDVSKKGRYNFTQVHEAGHHILEWLYPGEYGGKVQKLQYYRSDYDFKPKNWEEWQVDTLTCYILMPEELVKQALFMFGFEDKIHVINRIHAKKDYEKFSMMADFLGVSKQALSIRLSQLGLVGRNDFDDPDSLLDIFQD